LEEKGAEEVQKKEKEMMDLHLPPLHKASALGDVSIIESILANTKAGGSIRNLLNEREELLGRSALHLAAGAAHLDVVRLLVEEPTVDAGALDDAGRSPLDHAQTILDQFKGNAEWDERLNRVIDMLMEADLLKQVRRQKVEGVTLSEGQRVRDYMQSQIDRSVRKYWPEVIISYATGTRKDLDGEGCGPGMMFCHLVVRHLARAGIPCFTGLHVEGGYNWHMYFEKLRKAKIMIVIMTPAFFESAACFKEQLEARRNGLEVIPLLFQLEDDGSAPGSIKNGGKKWIEEYRKKKKENPSDRQVARDTLCAFRVPNYDSDEKKINSEPAPPNTMLDSEDHDSGDLLDKLVRRVRRTLDDSKAAGPVADLDSL